MRKFILLVTLSILCLPLLAQGNYELAWSDEFESEIIDTEKWNYETGGNGWGNKELQYYTNRSDNGFIRDGKLVIKVLKEDYNGMKYTSTRLASKSKGFTKYGKIEALIKLPKGKGTWPAFWMMPQSSYYGAWPRSGEIDIMEHVGSDPTMISHAVHTQEKNGSKGNNWFKKSYPEGDLENEFHLYGLEWFDNKMEFYIDGIKQVTLWNNMLGNQNSWPFDQEFYVILNVAVGGVMGGAVDDNIFNSDVEMEVEYVRIYKNTTLRIEQNNTETINIISNPQLQNVTIQGLEKKSTIILFDSLGKKHKQISTTETDYTIDTSDLVKGIYVLSIQQGDKRSTHKVII